MGLKDFFSKSVDGNAAMKEYDSNNTGNELEIVKTRRPKVTSGRIFSPSANRQKLPNALRTVQPLGSASVALAREKEAISLLSSTPITIQELRSKREQALTDKKDVQTEELTTNDSTKENLIPECAKTKASKNENTESKNTESQNIEPKKSEPKKVATKFFEPKESKKEESSKDSKVQNIESQKSASQKVETKDTEVKSEEAKKIESKDTKSQNSTDPQNIVHLAPMKAIPEVSLESTVAQISEEQISLRAWTIWQEKGCQAGQEFENWLQAEEELKNELLKKD